MKKRITLKGFSIGFFLIVTNLIAFAQPVSTPQGGDGGDDPCFDTVCVPIDSGIIFLLIAGTLLAIRMIYVFNKKSSKA